MSGRKWNQKARLNHISTGINGQIHECSISTPHTLHPIQQQILSTIPVKYTQNCFTSSCLTITTWSKSPSTLSQKIDRHLLSLLLLIPTTSLFTIWPFHVVFKICYNGTSLLQILQGLPVSKQFFLWLRRPYVLYSTCSHYHCGFLTFFHYSLCSSVYCGAPL